MYYNIRNHFIKVKTQTSLEKNITAIKSRSYTPAPSSRKWFNCIMFNCITKHICFNILGFHKMTLFPIVKVLWFISRFVQKPSWAPRRSFEEEIGSWWGVLLIHWWVMVAKHDLGGEAWLEKMSQGGVAWKGVSPSLLAMHSFSSAMPLPYHLALEHWS